ncbi:MAG: hypothetical protein ACOCZ5_01915 [bacterium]
MNFINDLIRYCKFEWYMLVEYWYIWLAIVIISVILFWFID